MLNEKNAGGVAPGSPEGARSATGGGPGAVAEIKRWSAARKKEVVLRLLRGEPVDAVSREVAVPIYKLEQWRDRALAGIDAGLKERENDPVANQLDDANRRIGELVMEVEILQKERRAKRRLVGRRSSLRRRWQALRFGAGLSDTRFSPLDYLRAAGPGIDQGGAVAPDAARAEADRAGCRAPGGHPRRSGSFAL